MYVKQEAIEKTDRKHTEHRRQKTETKPRDAPSNSQTIILLLMPLELSIIGVFLNSLVDCAVSFNCLDFQSTTTPKVTHSAVGS